MCLYRLAGGFCDVSRASFDVQQDDSYTGRERVERCRRNLGLRRVAVERNFRSLTPTDLAKIYTTLFHHHMWYTHTHTHQFNGPFSRTTRVGRYQKGKTNLDFTKARDSEWQWHQLGHMHVCTSLQIDNYASTSSLSFLQATSYVVAQHK